MMIRRRAALGAGIAAIVATPALAFPDRTITLATGFAPGGSTDVTARLLADRLGPALGANARVVVENRPGAAGIIASDWMRRQPPDGYLLMLVEASSHALAPNAVQGGTRYDALTDFTHIAMVGTGPMIVVTQPGFKGRTPQDVISRLKQTPDSLPFASSGVASMPHLSAEMLASVIGMGGKFTHAPYRSGGLMVESIARGETQWGVAVLASAAGQVRDGRVRGVAVTGLERFPSFPDIPTLNEGALPGFDLENWFAVIGPRGIPAPIVSQINQAVRTAIAEPQLRERLLVAGVAPWTRPNEPSDAQAFFRAELGKFRQVVERTGVKLEP